MNCTKKTKINLIEKINMMIHVLNLTKRDEKFIYIYIYMYNERILLLHIV